MISTARFRRLLATSFAAAMMAGVAHSAAADSDSSNGGSAPKAAVASSSGVDIFDAMRNGDIGVQFIPRNSREASLILTNNTDQPLTVHAPDAFAAIPVLAQPLGQPATSTTGAHSKQSQNQTLSSTSNTQSQQNQQNQPFGQPRAPGLFSIAPERVVKLKVPAVCLEYGKQEPTAHVPYMIEPLDSYTKSPELQELCRLLGTDKVDQKAVQAAAWHLANHMSWDQLTALKFFPHNHGFSRPVFTADQIRAAKDLTERAIKMAEARSADKHPAELQADSAKSASTGSPEPIVATTK